MSNYDISDFDYMMSSLGNAYFSNVSYESLWSAVILSDNREELDAAITATADLNDLVNDET